MPRLSTVLNAGCRTRFAPESLESVIASPAARDAISSRASLLDYSYKEFIKHILRIARSMASETAGPSHNRSFLAGPLASLPWARAFAACRSRLRCPVLSFVNLGLWRLRLWYDLRSATSPRDIQDSNSSVRDADCGVRTGIVREKGRAWVLEIVSTSVFAGSNPGRDSSSPN